MNPSNAPSYPRQSDASPLKLLLCLIAIFFAIAATLLSIFLTSAATATGSSPYYAISLSNTLSTGILGPGEQRWFRVTASPHGDTFQPADFSLFYMGNGDGVPHQVNFELFSNAEILAWERGAKERLSNFGAGMAVSRDGDPRVGERLWHGVLLRDQTYFLAIENGSDLAIDYWLYNQDMVALPTEALNSPVTTNVAPVQADLVVAVPAGSPQAAVPIITEKMWSALAPGQESWYSFSVDNNPAEAFEPAAFTMISTPDDTNQAERVTFEVFTAAGVNNWSVNSRDAVDNVGAGSVVYRDDNPLTAERFWGGWVVSGDLYFVRVRNGADIPVDVWLFNGDVYGPELGLP